MDLKKGSSLYHAFKSKPLESNKSQTVYPPLTVERPQGDSVEERNMESIRVERLDHVGVLASVIKD